MHCADCVISRPISKLNRSKSNEIAHHVGLGGAPLLMGCHFCAMDTGNRVLPIVPSEICMHRHESSCHSIILLLVVCWSEGHFHVAFDLVLFNFDLILLYNSMFSPSLPTPCTDNFQ
jgi:hypothetical protein